MAWFTLIIAGLLETFGVAMINQLSVKRNWQTVILLILGFGSSLALLSYSLQFIPMGTGYAIWTGIGVVGGALIGMIFYGESKDWKRMVFIAMVLCSVIGLKLIT
ncbi:QacE family quaternary ammonium compound efflux SMR transporter [Oceanobacillus oncorhynchi subsp. incaldanensis]|uniref:Multidrug resistance protein YkkD n=1 Tax=Oceanobacillus oncorhynchi TaxID=545501 RepID=A0A0A1MQ54_9BACI|nr:MULTISPECIES: multidrug efflux SMR transporter [Oceanobacillus]GIO20786.1 QacE family quaternary ammonium compound efflux SMR transporter [Oceanobacillus oncorhynchi subsp. incaldanensis]CEI81747.1 Multidrug resistance protein YkkD [Oceanobacillus oncorhynchi]